MNIRMQTSIRKWDVFELTLTGPGEGNPFVEVHLSARFQYGSRVVEAYGFYDGNGIYKVRFMPDVQGKWTFVTCSNHPQLDGLSGEFECIEAQDGVHGLVRVVNTFHFVYDDGTPYYPVGTTCYVWNHQGDTLEEQTLQTLKTAPFNKLRMCVFPKHYDYNENEPVYHPFEGSVESGWDFSRFNPLFFRHLEKRIQDLMAMGIEADLILFHPYDRWGYSTMNAEQNIRYLEYITARLAAFRNIWWALANEYDLMPSLTMNDWDSFFRLIQQRDPYQHLRSIHNCRGFYDNGKPWVTHCSIQHSDLSKVIEWRNLYQKPIVVDECCYEGNISRLWGSITAQELVHRFWEGFSRGGYVGHGETYVHPQDILWWAKGGVLHGESPSRIAFLKKIMDEAPGMGIDTADLWVDTAAAAGIRNEYFLAYYGYGQSVYKDLILPEGNRYRIEVIDTWNMTITPLEGTFSGKCRVPLPGKAYIALRIFRV